MFELPKLPYGYDALEPYIDARTMEIHYTKHHAAYVSSLNKSLDGHGLEDITVDDLVASIHKLPEEIRSDVRKFGGGHANHTLFWNVMGHDVWGNPQGDLAMAITDQLGGYDSFKEMFSKKAMGRFGSGWAWLSLDTNQRLVVEDTPNQNSPLMHGNTPLVGIDVWEHAYYLKYQNRRADYIQAFFHVVDWKAVELRYREALVHPVHAIHS